MLLIIITYKLTMTGNTDHKMSNADLFAGACTMPRNVNLVLSGRLCVFKRSRLIRMPLIKADPDASEW